MTYPFLTPIFVYSKIEYSNIDYYLAINFQIKSLSENMKFSILSKSFNGTPYARKKQWGGDGALVSKL